MNYEDMSDHEINKRVAEKLGLRVSSESEGFLFVDTAHRVVNIKPISANVDYCNNWSDMGPVIQDSGIDIEWPEFTLGGVGQCTKYVEGAADIAVEFTQKDKGLRAAAICFLELNKVEA